MLGLGFSVDDVKIGVGFHLWPSLPGFGHLPNEPFFMIRIFRAFDLLSSIPGAKIIAQNAIFDKNEEVIQKLLASHNFSSVD